MENLIDSGISASTLRTKWARIRCTRKLFINDSCHSAGGTNLRGEFDDFRGIFGGRGKIAMLASDKNERSGEITADRFDVIKSKLNLDEAYPEPGSFDKEQEEKAKEERGGGIFTHFLLTGLSGFADAPDPETNKKDGIVSVGELKNYLNRIVSKAAQVLGHTQHPVIEIAEASGTLPLTTQ